MYCTTDLCVTVKKLKNNNVSAQMSVSALCRFCQLLKLRIPTPLFDRKRCSASLGTTAFSVLP